jgi:hypothetical protein
MGFSRLRELVRKIAGPRRSRTPSRPFARTILRLELFEDRLTPAAVSWTGGGDGTSWTDGRNWSTGAAPGTTDDVTINSTFSTINHTGTDTVNSLTVLSGTLNNSGSLTTNQGVTLNATFGSLANTGTLTVDGAFAWTDGTLSGAGTLVLNGSSTLSGGFSSMLTDQQVDNNGSATIADGNSIDFRGNAVWNNETGSTFTLQGSGSVSTFFASATSAFNNAGTLAVTAGASPTSTASIGVAFNNTGTVDVQAGTLSLGAGGTGGGTFTVATGATLSAGNYTLNNATINDSGSFQVGTFNNLTVSGASTIQNLTINGGTVTANAALTIQNLTLSNGTLTGPATVTVAGNFNWTGGTLSGTGDTVLDGTSTLTGSFFSPLERQVDNFGTATVVAGTSLNFENNAIWNNDAGSTLILPDSAGMSPFFSSGSQFNNAGTVEKTAPGGTASIGITFNNTGTVDVQAGTLSLTAGGTGSGTFTIESGATLSVSNYTLNNATVSGAGALTVNGLTVSGTSSLQNLTVTGSTVTVNGPLGLQNLTISGGTVIDNSPLTVQNLIINGGTLTDNSSLTAQNLTLSSGTLNANSATSSITAQNLTFSGGTLTGPGTITVDNNFTWTAGTLSGTGDTVLDGTSSITGSFFSPLERQVDNFGTASAVAGTSVTFENNAVWNNDAGSTFILPDSASLTSFFSSGSAFNNAGTVEKTAPNGTATIGITFNNTGTVDVQFGTLSLTGGGTGGGTFTVESAGALAASNYTLNNATVNDAGVFQVGTFNNLTISGPSSIENLTINGGTVTANAALTVQNLTISGGTLTDNSTLTVQNLTLSNGTLNANSATSSITAQNLTFSGGTLTGPGTITIDGNFNWTGGSLTGTGDTVLDGTSSLTGSFFSALSRQVDNFGTASVVAGTSLNFQNNAIWNNNAGSTLILPDSAGMSPFFSSGSQFNNAGTVEKTAPGGTATIGITFNNTGTVDVQSGTLSLTGGGTGSGTFTIESGAVLSASSYTLQNATVSGAGMLQAGNLTIGGTTTIQNLTVSGSLTIGGTPTIQNLTVSGTVTDNTALTIQNLIISGGTFTANSPLEVQNLTLSGGTLTGPANITVDDSFTWTGGTPSGTGNLILDGTSSITGSFFSPLSQQVENFGTASVVDGTSVYFENNANWNNEPGSTFILPDTASLTTFFSNSVFTNAGTVEKTAPNGTATIGLTFNNTGTVDVQSGTLNLSAGGTGGGTFIVESGATLSAGNYTLSNATVNDAGSFQIGTFNNLTISGPSTIENLTIDGGTVTANAALTIQNLTMTGGTLTGPATVTIEDNFNWQGGSLTGTGDTVLDGTSTLTGSFFSPLERQVDNFGTATVVAGTSVTFENNAIWNNQPGSTLILPDSAGLSSFFSGGSAFNNAGTVEKTAPNGTSTISIAFNNTGTVDVQSGTLSLVGGGTGSGTFTIESGAVLSASSYTLQNATVSGAGTLQAGNLTIGGTTTIQNLTVSGGTVTDNTALTIQNLIISGGTFTANSPLEVQNLTLSGGTLTGPANITVDDGFTWTGGTLSGTGDTVLDGTSSLTGSFFSPLKRQVDNFGTATVVAGTSVTFENNAVWNNDAGSTFILPDSASLTSFFSGGSAFNNAGTVEKTAPNGTSTIGVAFNNTGTVDVQFGTLSLNAGGTGSGTFTIESGVLNIGNYTLQNATVTGAGTVQVNTFNSLTIAGSSSIQNLTVGGGTVTANAALDVQNFVINGTLTGPGAVTVDDSFTWTGGTISGTGDTILNGTSTLSGGFFSMLSRLIDNNGTATLANGNSVDFTGNAVWNNNATGTLVLQGGGSLGNFFASATAVLNNAGLILTEAPVGTSGIGIPVNNTGTIEVDAGTLSLSSLTNYSGTTLTGGTYLLTGVLQVPNADIHTNDATIVLNGPTGEFFNSGFFSENDALTNLSANAAGGSLTLENGRALTTSDALSNAGTISVGAGSSLSATGNYTQTGGSTVVNGTLAANNTVAINAGSLSGAGTINANVINGGTVTPGDAPAILTVNGTYTQTSTGALDIQIGGTTAGSGYGQLAVSGAATLDGTLNVTDLNNFQPVRGNAFEVMTFSSNTGNFATLNGLTFGDGIVLQPQLASGDTGLNLVAFTTTATTVTSSATNNTAVFGQTESFTANVTAGDGSIPTGSVQFQLNGVNFGSPVNLVGGSATIDASSLPAGTYQVTVIYSGSGTQFDLGSTSAPLTYTVNPDPTTTTLTSNVGITAVGQNVTFTATVTANAPGSGTPTGSVSFFDGTSLLGTVNLPPGGPDQISFTTSALTVGTHAITAVYSGDNNFVTSTSNGTSEIILGPGVAVFGTSLYVVGANTADYVQISPVGSSNTGSTGLQVNSLLNNVWSSQTFNQPFTDVHIFGDDGNDTIQMASTLTVNAFVTEGNGTNYIQTAGGNDTITTGHGGNTIESGNGNKTITAQDAAGTGSYIQLGTGTDVVTLGAGNDQVVVGGGNNTVTAGDGNDSVQTGNGNNTITLGNGNEYIHTGTGADVITLGNGNETILTGNGNKTITAGNGQDFVQAGTGSDAVTLGGGNDTVLLGAGGNTVALGNGRDFVQAGKGDNTVTVGNGNGDTVLVGDGNNVVVTGNGNNDFVQAGNGDNLIVAGTGSHTVLAGNGSNILIDGSVALTQPGDSLRAVLDDWMANGSADADEIRARLLVSYNTSNPNYLAAGSGLDWFWDTFSGDTTNKKSTDLLN